MVYTVYHPIIVMRKALLAYRVYIGEEKNGLGIPGIARIGE